jgi:hypothetical protein
VELMNRWRQSSDCSSWGRDARTGCFLVVMTYPDSRAYGTLRQMPQMLLSSKGGATARDPGRSVRTTPGISRFMIQQEAGAAVENRTARRCPGGTIRFTQHLIPQDPMGEY